MKVVLKKISDIIPYWNNPRNNDAAVDAVVESIKEFGVCQPILVDAHNVIIAGHSRYKAMQRLKVDEAPCIVLELSEQKAREYRIIDNKTAEKATWDQEKLISELRAFESVEKFTILFPELKLQTPDMTIANISEEDISKATQSTTDKFTHVVAQREAQIVTYTCPHCGEEFDAKA